jgi:Flp pilus assembly protein TadG
MPLSLLPSHVANLKNRQRLAIWQDREGAVALAFGLACIPLALLIGLAVDFGFIAQARAQLDLAADTAALTATKTAGAAFVANVGTTQAIAQGENDGTNWFTAQVGLIPNASVTATNVLVTNTGNTFNSTVTYQAKVATFFSALFGVQFVDLTNASAAQIIANAYVDVTFLLDNSSSMLIASTLAGVTALETATALASSLPATDPRHVSLAGAGSDSALAGDQCAFACHWSASNKDYYGIARGIVPSALSSPVQLRFDVVQSATAIAIGLMQAAEASSGISNQFGTSVYTFNNALTLVYPGNGQPTCHGESTVGCDISGDSGSAQTAAAAFQNPVTTAIANTWFPQIMASLAAASTEAGDGSSASTPRKALIIVTDGIQDWTYLSGPDGADSGARTPVPNYAQTAGASGNNPGGAEGPINPADCAAMKALGYDVYVLYTTYITQDASGNQNPLVIYNTFLVPYVNGTGTPASYNLATNLQACASSPSNFAQASDPAAITAAMTAMLQSVINSGARLTQ